MDGENNGTPYEQMDDLGGFTPLFLGWHPYVEMGIIVTIIMNHRGLHSKKNPRLDWVFLVE